jgi:hypothetical protein
MTDIAYREKILFFSIGFGQFDFVVVLTPGISKVFLCFAIKLLKLMIKSNFKLWVLNKKRSYIVTLLHLNWVILFPYLLIP